MTEEASPPGKFDHWISTVKVLISIAIIAGGTYAILNHVAPA